MTKPFDITADPLPNGTLIEASAGTGKTHAVAAYVAKALATTEDLRIGEILVTTFTRNAAAELRERIRGRLVTTAQLLRGRSMPASFARDELDTHLLGDAPAAADMARRLERAVAEFDTATIGTIHAICSRVLRLAGIMAADTGDEELRDRVLDEVVNDAVVTEAIAGRHWDERRLREFVQLRMADPFLETTFDPAECPADGRSHLDRLPDLVDACVQRARERMRASPSFDELLVRAYDEVTIRGEDSPAERKRKLAFLDTLREKFKLAIVDEAQDTNRLQWEFFHAIFPPTGRQALIAVGDPKQAIYRFRGADVTAYITHAQDGVPPEDGEPPRRTLSVNRRSDGPLLGGLNAVMAGAGFGAGIGYRAVDPAPGREATPLVGLRPVEFLDVGGLMLVEAAVRKVGELLNEPHVRPSEPRPFRPGEICVLVRTNATGAAIARRLADLAIPAVTEGTASVMNGQMAVDLRCLLEAMERPSDPGRARRAAATAFFGENLADVASLGEAREQEVQSGIAAFHAILQRSGIAAMATSMLADRTMIERIATGDGGDRRVVDLAHLVELLGDASGGRGCHAREMLEHVAALAARDEKAELVSRRVESDAEAVTIMTVHAAKGLQFPCVVVVDAWNEKKAAGQPVVFHRGGTRLVDVGKAVPLGDVGQSSKAAALEAENEELRRLVYVAVTRPEHHVCILRTSKWQGSLLGVVLPQAPATAADIGAGETGMIAVRRAADLPEPQPWTPPGKGATLAVAAVPPAVVQTYRRTSFSGIVSQAARLGRNPHAPVDRGHDEIAATATAAPQLGEEQSPEPAGGAATTADATAVSRFTIAELPAGTAFGSVVHEIFEQVEAGPGVAEADLRAAVHRVVGGVATARFLEPHRAPLAAVIADAMLTPFGGPAGAAFREARFADFSPRDRLAEMDFEMALAAVGRGVQARHVGCVLQRMLGPDDPLAGYAARLAGPAFDVRLGGLINGSIDAVLRLPASTPDDPRLVIADYKTNRLHERDAATPLAAYAPANLVAAMAEHDYPLQSLVYGTAVWRLLRWRLGSRKPAGWDPGECIAGIVYGFVRGMKGPDTPEDATGGRYGVFTWQPPSAIWSRLSRLFAGDLTEVEA
jgi:exodeoxyribonuclease V beta subunit